MAEQRRDEKIRGIIGYIIKWVGLGLLTILLILALIFRAPWKMTTLLAIFFTAFMILPRRARRWFWISVGAVVIAVIIWILLPENDQGWRPYTFDKEFAEFRAKHGTPDEENAALAYDAILETLDTESNQPEFFLKSIPSSIAEFWLSKDHPKTAEWLKGHQDTIARLLQATQKNKCYFPIPVNSFDFGRYIERLAPMRQCAFLLLSSANNDVGEGRIDAGLEKYLCTLRIADDLYQPPTQMYKVISFAFESRSLSLLNRAIIENQLTTEQLQRISDCIRGPENNWSSDFMAILEYDKLFAKNTFCHLAYEINQKGKVRFNRNYWRAAAGAVYSEIRTPTYSERKLNKARTILNWFIYPSSPLKAAETVDIHLDKLHVMAEHDFDWLKKPPQLPFSIFNLSKFRRDQLSYKYYAQFTAAMSESSYYNFHDTYLRYLTLRRGSRILLELRRYRNRNGRWPAGLEEIRSQVQPEVLVDPFNKGNFVYKLTEDGFTLYSKGENGIDDGGRKSTASGMESNLPRDSEDDILLWPVTIARK